MEGGREKRAKEGGKGREKGGVGSGRERMGEVLLKEGKEGGKGVDIKPFRKVHEERRRGSKSGKEREKGFNIGGEVK